MINEPEKLLVISDEQFLKYTEQDRRELVEKFAGIKDNRDFLTNVPLRFTTNCFWQVKKPLNSGTQNDGVAKQLLNGETFSSGVTSLINKHCYACNHCRDESANRLFRNRPAEPSYREAGGYGRMGG